MGKSDLVKLVTSVTEQKTKAILAAESELRSPLLRKLEKEKARVTKMFQCALECAAAKFGADPVPQQTVSLGFANEHYATFKMQDGECKEIEAIQANLDRLQHKRLNEVAAIELTANALKSRILLEAPSMGLRAEIEKFVAS